MDWGFVNVKAANCKTCKIACFAIICHSCGKRYVEIPKKQGKQLAVDTPIPTPLGWSTMGYLMVGDFGFAETSKPCRITSKSTIDNTEQAYRLTFRDAFSIVIVGERHLWSAEYNQGKVQKIWPIGEIHIREHKGIEAFMQRVPQINIGILYAFLFLNP